MSIFILMSALYLVFLLVVIIAWHRIPSDVPDLDQHSLTVSVIIPIRNEAEHIERLLTQIGSQDYPNDLYEVIVVDDHSTDGTVDIVQGIINNTEMKISLISLPKSKTGKKAALQEGISIAQGEVIVTTDGDCEIGGKWLETISNAFTPNIQMVFGPVAIRSERFFDRLQMMDFAALIGLGAATWKLGMAGMCNGANLAFRKTVFQECNGYEGSEQHPSGDDEFLLRKVHERYSNGIHFVKNKRAVVFTDAQPDLRSFGQQRIRWAGKWKLHRDVTTKLVAVFIFVFYTSMLIVTGQTLLSKENTTMIIGIWGVKWLLDIILVSSVLRLSSQKLPIIESVILSIIYPFYAIGIGISTINYTFEWKGRKY